MSGLVAIYRREPRGLFVGPLAWILLCIALVLNGYLYSVYLKLGTDVDAALRMTLGNSIAFWVLVILFPPLLTMRMISEEPCTGRSSSCLTAPVTDAAVVTGKFLAALTFMGLLWASVFVYRVRDAVGRTRGGLGHRRRRLVRGDLVLRALSARSGFTSSLTSVPVAAALARRSSTSATVIWRVR